MPSSFLTYIRKRTRHLIDATVSKGKSSLINILQKVPLLQNYINSVRLTSSENIDLKNAVQRRDTLIASSRSPSLFNDECDFLTERLMTHPVKIPLKDFVLESHSTNELENRVEVAARLINAYHFSLKDEPNFSLKRQGEDLWTGLLRNELPELLSTVETRDPERLAAFLRNFGTTFVWFGGITTCIDGYNRDRRPSHVALSYHDKLVSLAESLGVIRHENPENGPWGDNLTHSPGSLAKGIEEKLGINISPPMGIVHTDGIRIGESLLHYRHINSLYSATRLHAVNYKNEPVCEYGGGLGITAMYSKRLGTNDYSVLDLPITCLLAGHYLIHAIGENNVSLYGEEQKDDSVKILPYWCCQTQPNKRFGFAINQDSFPEIDDNLIMEYLNQIKRTVREQFLSINHECFAPRTVNNFAAQSGGFHKIHRSKCWVREGYVEELFQIQ